MSIFDVDSWLKSREALSFKELNIDGVVLNIMSLTKEQEIEVLGCDSYEAAIDRAASLGLSTQRSRWIEHDQRKHEIDALWLHPMINTEAEPTIRYRIGEEVCELTGFMSEVRAIDIDLAIAEHEVFVTENGSTVIDGDKLPDPEPTLDELTPAGDDFVNYALTPET